MRRAQSQLRADELRRLGRQRQSAVSGLAREARSLVAARGHPISDAAGRQVEETLNAALADPDAARAVVSRRLVRPLEHTGMGPVDINQAVAAAAAPAAKPVAGPAPASAGAGAGKGTGAKATSEAEAEVDRRRAEAEGLRRQQETAEAEVRRAETAAADSDAALREAEERRAATSDHVRRLEHGTRARRGAKPRRLRSGPSRPNRRATTPSGHSKRRDWESKRRLTGSQSWIASSCVISGLWADRRRRHGMVTRADAPPTP